MILAVLFDLGGTLDGPGRHWEGRFAELFEREGLPFSVDQLNRAFGYSTRSAYADAAMATRSLRETVQFHIERQMEQLECDQRAAGERIVATFVRDSEAALAASRSLLQRLYGRVRLGVISNFYGNARRILDDAGIAALLDVVIDSTCVGCSKPDPKIFGLALDALGTAPAATLFVGDSFDKDILPAHRLGLRTAWLPGADARACPDPTAVDYTLHRLEEVAAIVAEAQ